MYREAVQQLKSTGRTDKAEVSLDAYSDHQRVRVFKDRMGLPGGSVVKYLSSNIGCGFHPWS